MRVSYLDGSGAQFALFLGLLWNVASQALLLVLPPLGRRLGFSDIQSLLCGVAGTYRQIIALGLMLPGNLAALSLRTPLSAQGKAAGINAIGQVLGLALAALLAVTALRGERAMLPTS